MQQFDERRLFLVELSDQRMYPFQERYSCLLVKAHNHIPYEFDKDCLSD
jgi:hypothetical protein